MTFHAFPRSEAPELLDADALPLEHLAGSLRDIVRVNRFLGDAAVEAELPDPNSPVTIIDVGTGAGDLARILAGWARDSRRPPTNDGHSFPNGINFHLPARLPNSVRRVRTARPGLRPSRALDLQQPLPVTQGPHSALDAKPATLENLKL